LSFFLDINILSLTKSTKEVTLGLSDCNR